MPLKQITFSKKYPYAQFLNYDIGYVWELSDGETREEIEKKLLQMAENHHRTNYPHLHQEQGVSLNVEVWEQHTNEPIPNNTPITPPTKKLSQQELILQEVSNSKSIKQLKEWELLANKYPNTKEAYNNRLNELTK